MRDLKVRTQEFAIGCWQFGQPLIREKEYEIWARQLIKSSGSVGANYRAACRAKSTADFINKLKIVEEEADEAVYWLELFRAVHTEDRDKIQRRLNEAHQILAITVASIKTTRNKLKP